MKTFLKHSLDLTLCQTQLAELKQLLQANQVLSEQNDILPFFRARQQIAALMGSLHPRLNRSDLIAFEYDLFGDFSCDLVIGDSVRQSYCFVEFENAVANSVFVSNAKKVTPEWSGRFEHGFSQIVDWFWKLNDLERTEDFENRFRSRSIDYVGLLVIGRKEHLDLREQKRLQ